MNNDQESPPIVTRNENPRTHELTETNINYSNYSNHRMPSTIQISNETKALISTFGTKEDTYEDIIKRMYQLAVREHLREFLLSSEGTVSLAEARKIVNR